MRKIVLAAVLVLVASGAQATSLIDTTLINFGVTYPYPKPSSFEINGSRGYANISSLLTVPDVSTIEYFTLELEALNSSLPMATNDWNMTLLDFPLGSCRPCPNSRFGIADIGDRSFFFSSGATIIGSSYGGFNFPLSNNYDRLLRFVASSQPDLPIIRLQYPHSIDAFTLTGSLRLSVYGTPIPEPSTALLLGIGLAGMAARRRV